MGGERELDKAFNANGDGQPDASERLREDLAAPQNWAEAHRAGTELTQAQLLQAYHDFENSPYKDQTILWGLKPLVDDKLRSSKVPANQPPAPADVKPARDAAPESRAPKTEPRAVVSERPDSVPPKVDLSLNAGDNATRSDGGLIGNMPRVLSQMQMKFSASETEVRQGHDNDRAPVQGQPSEPRSSLPSRAVDSPSPVQSPHQPRAHQNDVKEPAAHKEIDLPHAPVQDGKSPQPPAAPESKLTKPVAHEATPAESVLKPVKAVDLPHPALEKMPERQGQVAEAHPPVREAAVTSAREAAVTSAREAAVTSAREAAVTSAREAAVTSAREATAPQRAPHAVHNSDLPAVQRTGDSSERTTKSQDYGMHHPWGVAIPIAGDGAPRQITPPPNKVPIADAGKGETVRADNKQVGDAGAGETLHADNRQVGDRQARVTDNLEHKHMGSQAPVTRDGSIRSEFPGLMPPPPGRAVDGADLARSGLRPRVEDSTAGQAVRGSLGRPDSVGQPRLDGRSEPVDKQGIAPRGLGRIDEPGTKVSDTPGKTVDGRAESTLRGIGGKGGRAPDIPVVLPPGVPGLEAGIKPGAGRGQGGPDQRIGTGQTNQPAGDATTRAPGSGHVVDGRMTGLQAGNVTDKSGNTPVKDGNRNPRPDAPGATPAEVPVIMPDSPGRITGRIDRGVKDIDDRREGLTAKFVSELQELVARLMSSIGIGAQSRGARIPQAHDASVNVPDAKSALPVAKGSDEMATADLLEFVKTNRQLLESELSSHVGASALLQEFTRLIEVIGPAHTDDAGPHRSEQPAMPQARMARESYIVRDNDSLTSIAMSLFHDERVSYLLYDINKDSLPATLVDGVIERHIAPGLVLYLPTRAEITRFMAQVDSLRDRHLA